MLLLVGMETTGLGRIELGRIEWGKVQIRSRFLDFEMIDWKGLGCFKMFQGCFKEVSMKLFRRLNVVSIMFQESFRSVCFLGIFILKRVKLGVLIF